MKKQMFEELLSSVREAGAILRGEKEPLPTAAPRLEIRRQLAEIDGKAAEMIPWPDARKRLKSRPN